jgi:hypothetical protein
MFVKEFGRRPSAAELNKQLESVYSWSLNLSEMQQQEAREILQGMSGRIRKIRESSQGHHAERDRSYMEALLVTKVLESWIDEHEEQQRIMERKLKKAEMDKREKYVKGMKKVKGDFEKRYGKDRGEEVMYATATKMAKKESVEEAMAVLRGVLYGDVSMLSEGEIDSASALIAARDMVDSVQDVIEKISKMMNEDLPAMTDVLRDNVGMDQASSYSSSVAAALAPLLQAAQTAREGLDMAARGLTGESVPPASTPPAAPDMGADIGAEPDMGSELPLPPEEDNEEEPESGSIGRAKRI